MFFAAVFRFFLRARDAVSSVQATMNSCLPTECRRRGPVPTSTLRHCGGNTDRVLPLLLCLHIAGCDVRAMQRIRRRDDSSARLEEECPVSEEEGGTERRVVFRRPIAR